MSKWLLGAVYVIMPIAFLSALVWAESVTRSDDYVLVWADEFNADGRPDPNNWTYEHGFVRNEELQGYQPDNARCEKGLLIIEDGCWVALYRRSIWPAISPRHP